MAIAIPFSYGVLIMEKEQRIKRITELLEKEDMDHKDYDELISLVREEEKEYYRLKEKYKTDLP